jgi:hypothetical protein
MSVWSAIPDLQRATGLERPELSRRLCRINLLLMRSAPLEYLKEVAWATGSYWIPTPPDLAHFGSRFLQLFWGLLWLVLLLLFFACLVVLAGLLALRFLAPGRHAEAHRDDTAPAALALALAAVLYTAVVSTVVEVGSPRYRAPTELVIWFSTLLGFTVWIRSARRLAG